MYFEFQTDSSHSTCENLFLVYPMDFKLLHKADEYGVLLFWVHVWIHSSVEKVIWEIVENMFYLSC